MFQVFICIVYIFIHKFVFGDFDATDINLAGAKAAHDFYENGEHLLTDLQPHMVEAIKQATMKKMRVFQNR